MFFEGERIDAMREMILAENVEERKKALAKLLPYQREDFVGIFKALNGYPATIRFLDPPLHEFLPHEAGAQEELARKMGVPAERVKQRVKELHEFNPMLGFRGCRLGVVYDEISEMQARAVFEAAAQVQAAGNKGEAGDHDSAGWIQEGTGSSGGSGPSRRKGSDEGEESEVELPGRHDDRSAARRSDSRRDCRDRGVLQFRHERPDADGLGMSRDDSGLFPSGVCGTGDREEESVRDDRSDRASVC